jgi:hypothetical protein
MEHSTSQLEKDFWWRMYRYAESEINSTTVTARIFSHGSVLAQHLTIGIIQKLLQLVGSIYIYNTQMDFF